MARSKKKTRVERQPEAKTLRNKLLVVSLCVLLGGAAFFLSRWRPRAGLRPGLFRGYNLLLVTIDTLRADVLSVYGGPAGLTPNLDRLASQGVRFTSAFAHATTTLPSHASILTGEYPFRHGVRDNGLFRLDDSRLTLAEILKGTGYRTGAFVGAFVLDTRFGLAQGFDRYDDFYGEETGSTGFNFLERKAEEVLKAAAGWIEKEKDRHWFAWVHLFDPHVPYEPPRPFQNRHPYEGEVAYADHALGSFLDELASMGELEQTLVVVTADHGESLGEHGETTHGAFAYNATLRVPLIFWRPPELHPGVVDDAVGHVDMVPTLLELLGAPMPDSLQGRTLLPRLGGHQGGSRSPVYFEALSGFLTESLAPLTGIIEGEYKFIDLPIPELYHLASDPREERNLLENDTARSHEFRSALRELVGTSAIETAVQPTPLDEESRERLQALGYVASASPLTKKNFTGADDPKNAIHSIEMRRAALERYASGEPEEAVSLLRGVIDERPDFTLAYLDLASVLLGEGRLSEAIALLKSAAQDNPQNPRVLGKLGTYLSEAGRLEEAGRILENAADKAPNDADIWNALGVNCGRMGKQEEARQAFRRVLTLDPSSARAETNMGTTYLGEADFSRAAEHFRRATELAPGFWLAYEGLGAALAADNHLSEAVETWKQLVELNPQSYDALYNLGMALVELERNQEALFYLEKFLREAPPARHADDIEKVEALCEHIRKQRYD